MKYLSILLTVLLLAGCAHRNPYKGAFKIDTPRDHDRLATAYEDASSRLGMTHRGGTVKVRFAEGVVRSNDPRWLGRPSHDFDGIALGVYRPASRSIMLYTTNNRWRYETARWEFGRAIMDSRGIRTREAQERKMLDKGFR